MVAMSSPRGWWWPLACVLRAPRMRAVPGADWPATTRGVAYRRASRPSYFGIRETPCADASCQPERARSSRAEESAMTMTRRERVMSALGGKPVDRAPLAFWLHNFATENSAEELAGETVRLAKTFDWDYLKPQSRAQCFAEMWGLRFRPSRERAVQYTVTHSPFADADELALLAPVDPRTGALGEQLDALRAIRRAVGPDTPIIWTIFSPLMILPMLVRGGRDQALALLRSDPAAVEHAFDAMTETLVAYAHECVSAGADGLFYATNMATRELLR